MARKFLQVKLTCEVKAFIIMKIYSNQLRACSGRDIKVKLYETEEFCNRNDIANQESCKKTFLIIINDQ